MTSPIDSSTTPYFNEHIEKSLGLIEEWICSTSFPAPKINRSFAFNKNESIEITLLVPDLHLKEEELKFFSGMKHKKPHDQWAQNKIILAKYYLTAIRGDLETTSSGKTGTEFKVIIKTDDPFHKVKRTKEELDALLHPIKTLKKLVSS